MERFVLPCMAVRICSVCMYVSMDLSAICAPVKVMTGSPVKVMTGSPVKVMTGSPIWNKTDICQ